MNESVRRERHEMPSVEYTLGELSDARIVSKFLFLSLYWQIMPFGHIAPVRCELWLLSSSVGRRIFLTNNLHHTLWEILFHSIALRHFISAGTLLEKDVSCDPGGN